MKNAESPDYVKKAWRSLRQIITSGIQAQKGNAIFVFLSYRNVGLKETNKSTEKKQFFVIDGIKPEDFSVDIELLSFPGKFEIKEIKSKLPFSEDLTSKNIN